MAASLQQLTRYLQDGAATPFGWGACDCCLWVCDWVQQVRGVDPAHAFRGRYDSRHGAEVAIEAAGGFLPMVRGVMREAGLARTLAPNPGDIGVVSQSTGLALGIMTPTGWAVKGLRGIVVAPGPILAMWAIDGIRHRMAEDL